MFLSHIAQQIGGTLQGPDLEVTSLASPQTAKPGALLVVRGIGLEQAIASGAALVLEANGGEASSLIRVASVEAIWPKVLALFDQDDRWADGIHPTALVEAGALIDATASVGAFAQVRAGAQIARGAVVGPYVYVGEYSQIGTGTVVEARVTLYRHTLIGANCRVLSGAVLGSVGFGFQGAGRLPHTGNVVLEDGVEIGANTVIERAVAGETHIGAFSKIGDLCLIAHNCGLGKGVVMVGHNTLGGSVHIGDGVLMGGNTAVSDHIHIGPGARIAGGSSITKNVPAGATWASTLPARPAREHWQRLAVLDALAGIWQQVRKLLKE
jgi:UDP-3-O-[3-hydroxymyristoyl] glucosamine N-acyltransferase